MYMNTVVIAHVYALVVYYLDTQVEYCLRILSRVYDKYSVIYILRGVRIMRYKQERDGVILHVVSL